MANRQKYTVLVPFPVGGGHWSTVGQELELLEVEAAAWRTAGRLELTSAVQAAPVITETPAKKAPEKKAE